MFDAVEYWIEGEKIASGEEEVSELLDILEEGLQQCLDGKGMTTEELKERLKKRLTKYRKDGIIPTDINN